MLGFFVPTPGIFAGALCIPVKILFRNYTFSTKIAFMHGANGRTWRPGDTIEAEKLPGAAVRQDN